MADEKDKGSSFWTTLPGILTGVAAVLTALTGFWAAFHHAAPAGPPPTEHAVIVGGTAPSTTTSNTASTGVSKTDQPATPPASTAGTVTVHSRSGITTQFALKSFHHNMYGDAIQLASGQTIDFEKLHVIDFLTVDGNAHLVTLKITLVDGRTVDGDIASNYAFQGESDLGPFSIFIQDIKQITFDR